ncbi:hypothetical protein HDU81_007119 [Chytriomyces hyalinus]|nr:hypothetical protein HDU81_007119 [Chytriomyces hyalinus]
MTESKTELLGWLNDLLSLNYSSIEQCGSGSAFCQIIDSIYGTVPITRIKFDTKNEYDYVSNYKILQAVFNKHKIERNIPIDKLIKCRYSDNLEFLQWMKKYWDAFYPGGGYNAQARREVAMKAQLRTHTVKSPISPTLPNRARSSVKSLQGSPTGKQGLESRELVSRPSSSKGRLSSDLPSGNASRMGLFQKSDRQDMTSSTPQRHLVHTMSQNMPMSKAPSHMNMLSNVEQDRKICDLQRQVNELRAAADTLERERNFYYLKLRDLEAHVLEKMEKEESPTCHEIQTILYATEDGFVNPKKNPPKLAPIAPTVPRLISATPSQLKIASPTIAQTEFPVAYAVSDSVTSDGRRISVSQSAIVDRHRESLSRLAAASSFYMPPTSPDVSNDIEQSRGDSIPADPNSTKPCDDTSIAASDTPPPTKPQSRQRSRPASAAHRSSLRKSLGGASSENQMAKVMESPPALPTISKNSVVDKAQPQQQQEEGEELEDTSRVTAVDAMEEEVAGRSPERVSITSDLISYGTTMGE